MPELVELRPTLEAENVRVVAVSVDLALPQAVRTPAELAAFVEERGFALQVLALEGDFDALTEAHGWPGGLPFTVLFGPAGELDRIEGGATRAEFEALVARARSR
jgi:hypothetical protein